MSKQYRLLLEILVIVILAAVISNINCSVYASNEEQQEPTNSTQPVEGDKQTGNTNKSEVQTQLTEAKVKNRINVVLLGIEGKSRADTIMFISFDKAGNKLSFISIPRDTYFYEPGYNRGDQRKINAVYGRKGEKGYISAVSKLLGDTPVDYYISIDYEGVEKIIDLIGGVEADVPLDMRVSGISIAEGKQILHGREAITYLRYREKYKDGDIGRIKAQQKFVRSALSKVRYSDLPELVDEVFKSIRTNMPLEYMYEIIARYTSSDEEEVTMYILPGTPKYRNIENYNWSYFFHSTQKVSEMMRKINE